MTMNIKVNYISTIWWFLQAIILACSTSVLEFWIVEFFVCMVSLISILTNSLKIKVVLYLFLVGYSIVISYIIWLLWLFFVYSFCDIRTFYLSYFSLIGCCCHNFHFLIPSYPIITNAKSQRIFKASCKLICLNKSLFIKITCPVSIRAYTYSNSAFLYGFLFFTV